jgi:hypothetical protein
MANLHRDPGYIARRGFLTDEQRALILAELSKGRTQTSVALDVG